MVSVRFFLQFYLSYYIQLKWAYVAVIVKITHRREMNIKQLLDEAEFVLRNFMHIG